MAQPFIRRYEPDTDLADIVHVFRETCDDALKVEPVWTIGSYIWCRPYPVLSPTTCFVLDDGNGMAVGYILGTPDTQKFCDDWKPKYVPTVKSALENLPPPKAETKEERDRIAARGDGLLNLIYNDPCKSAFSSYASELQSWPGHLHINILPSHQRQGYGKHLINAFSTAAKAEGCPRAYLGMVASNDGAARFYEACGFRRLPHVLDNGASGEMGRTPVREDGGQTIYFVVDF